MQGSRDTRAVQDVLHYVDAVATTALRKPASLGLPQCSSRQEKLFSKEGALHAAAGQIAMMPA